MSQDVITIVRTDSTMHITVHTPEPHPDGLRSTITIEDGSGNILHVIAIQGKEISAFIEQGESSQSSH